MFGQLSRDHGGREECFRSLLPASGGEEQVVEAIDCMRVVDDAFRDLNGSQKEQYRGVATMLLQGKTAPEISEACQVPLNAVGSVMSAVKGRIRKSFYVDPISSDYTEKTRRRG